jgi:hypothetical protein
MKVLSYSSCNGFLGFIAWVGVSDISTLPHLVVWSLLLMLHYKEDSVLSAYFFHLEVPSSRIGNNYTHNIWCCWKVLEIQEMELASCSIITLTGGILLMQLWWAEESNQEDISIIKGSPNQVQRWRGMLLPCMAWAHNSFLQSLIRPWGTGCQYDKLMVDCIRS